MKYSNAICVDTINKSFIKSISNVFKKNHVLGIFPEGKRSEDGKIIKGFPGVSHIAIIFDVPVIPVGLKGFYDIMPKGKIFPRLQPCSINIGRPINVSKNKKDIPYSTQKIMIEIASLSDQMYHF